jgi:hypothetical protein
MFTARPEAGNSASESSHQDLGPAISCPLGAEECPAGEQRSRGIVQEGSPDPSGAPKTPAAFVLPPARAAATVKRLLVEDSFLAAAWRSGNKLTGGGDTELARFVWTGFPA